MTPGGTATGGPPAGGTGSTVPAAKASCGAPTIERKAEARNLLLTKVKR